MKKAKIFLVTSVLVTLFTVLSTHKLSADCGPSLPYIGTYIPFYEYGEQVGVQCVLGGNICKCIGEYYYW